LTIDTIPLVLTSPPFWYIGLSYFFLACGLYGITAFMIDYATYQIGLPLDKVILLATVYGTRQIIGILTILSIFNCLGRKNYHHLYSFDQLLPI